MNRLHVVTLHPILMPVSPADGQKEGECDVIQHFALFAQNFQMGIIPANARAGKDANLASRATVAGVRCTRSRFRLEPTRTVSNHLQHQQ